VTRSRRLAAAIPAVLVTFAVGGALASPAGAAAPPGLLLTVAARTCPTYSAITANLARNNIMESLQDLGPGTPYEAGQTVDPVTEARVQPECDPLRGWRFTLGAGYRTRAVSGPWGSLSIATGPFGTSLVTKRSTPLLDPQGLPSGRSIGGATTIELTPAQAELASRRSLWIQGGTPGDPILNEEFPEPRFGFGALRCAIDNVNGDNVEYIAYPAGVTHVFCFAYYVEPPPTSGTIVIRKEVTGARTATDETFGFDGNLSYNPGGHFDLAVKEGRPASETFYRGASGDGHGPWTVHEIGVPDWRLEGLDCHSRDGTSRFDASAPKAEASISLAAGDLVTCTFTDRYDPPPRGLLLRKVSEGGVGRFDFEVTPVGGGTATSATATTTEEGVAADGDPAPLDLDAGRYVISEQQPRSDAGRWVLKEVECDGDRMPVDQPIHVTVNAEALTTCTFHDAFIPEGSITISKVTRGAVGTSSFLTTRDSGELAEFQSSATTVREGDPLAAEGAATDRLDLGRYSILDIPPPPDGGLWSLTGVVCDGRAVPFAEGRIEVHLTAADPHRHCTFTNSFDPTPPPEPQGPQPVSPEADLVLEKSADVSNIEIGHLVGYEISVVNRGSGAAEEVDLVDQPLAPARLISVNTGQGSCGHALPLHCRLGDLAPGGRATIFLRLRPTQAGPFVNHAAAGTITAEAEPVTVQDDAAVEVSAAATHSPIHGLG
jgi:hypothetical protein